MTGPIVVSGAMLVFEPMFGPREVTLTEPAIIEGTGAIMIDGMRACQLGDEHIWMFPATYVLPGFDPGEGMVTIVELLTDQIAEGTGGPLPFITLGTQFMAQFIPEAPATQPGTPPVPDPSVGVPTPGFGSFVNSQDFVLVT